MSLEDMLAPIADSLAEAIAERQRIAAQLKTATGAEAEQYALALRALDGHIAKSKSKIQELEARVARAARLQAITEELKALNAAIVAEVAGSGETPRARELKQKAEALAEEGRTLLGQMPPPKPE